LHGKAHIIDAPYAGRQGPAASREQRRSIRVEAGDHRRRVLPQSGRQRPLKRHRRADDIAPEPDRRRLLKRRKMRPRPVFYRQPPMQKFDGLEVFPWRVLDRVVVLGKKRLVRRSTQAGPPLSAVIRHKCSAASGVTP
jgi:hypothetical protein